MTPRSSLRGSTLRILAALLCLTAPAATADAGDAPSNLIARLARTDDAAAQRELCQALITRAAHDRLPPVSDSLACLLYRGGAQRVSIASDLNRWNPSGDTLRRVPGTDIFFTILPLAADARLEYKFVIDSAWVLDPLNSRQAPGGFGPNSEIRMPAYLLPPDIVAHPRLPRGRLDTLTVRSRILGRSHPVTVYLPAGAAGAGERMPVIFVTDGGEYLRLASMDIVLDNCIAQGRIRPVIGVFVDPMTEAGNSATSTRMTDYALSSPFLEFLAQELRPFIASRYPASRNPRETAILGASLGGLTATFAGLSRPEVFGLSAAQSPAYWFLRDSIFTLARKAGRVPCRFYIDAGTLEQATARASAMRGVLSRNGNRVRYAEYPEGHNWANWRARLDDILDFFWGTR